MAVQNFYNAHWRQNGIAVAPDGPVCYSWCGWRRVDVAQPGQFVQITWLGRTANDNGGVAFALNTSGQVTVFKAGPFSTLWSGPTLTVGTWYWFGIVAQEEATTDDISFYWAERGDATITGPILGTYNGPWDFDRLGIGGGRSTNETNAVYGRISWAHEKAWRGPGSETGGDEARLTTVEMQAEYESGPPVSRLAINPSYWNDTSGLDLTEALDLTLVAGSGSVSSTDDPLDSGASETDLTPAVLDLVAVPAATAVGVVSVDLTPAGLSLTAVALEPSGDVVTVALTPASIEITAPSFDAVTEVVVVALAPALVSLAAVALMDTGAVDITVVLGSPRLRNTAVVAAPRQGTAAGQPRTRWTTGEPRTAVTTGAPRIDRSN